MFRKAENQANDGRASGRLAASLTADNFSEDRYPTARCSADHSADR